MRILFLSNWYPFPPDNGSKIRIYNLLRGLSEHHEVTLVSFCDQISPERSSSFDGQLKKIYTIPTKEYNPTSLVALIGLFSRKPRVLIDRYVREMERRINAEINSRNHDLIIASQIYMAAYLEQPRNIPAIFDEVEVGIFKEAVVRSRQKVSKARNQLTLWKLERYFQQLFTHFSACTVVSEAEKLMLMEMVPQFKSIEIIPNGIDLARYRDIYRKPKKNQMIFSGSLTYRPNYEAMLWFTKSVLPKINHTIPGAELIITGNNSNRRLLDSRRINLTGYVEDVRPLIASSWLSVVPIFSGGGTRVKMLEAFALRTPVVATSKGAEGLDVSSDVHLLIADTEEEFARQTIRLLTDEDLRLRLAENASKLVREKYDMSVIMPKVDNLIERLVNT